MVGIDIAAQRAGTRLFVKGERLAKCVTTITTTTTADFLCFKISSNITTNIFELSEFYACRFLTDLRMKNLNLACSFEFFQNRNDLHTLHILQKKIMSNIKRIIKKIC